MSELRSIAVLDLYRTRPKNWPVRISVGFMFALMGIAWLAGDFFTADTFAQSRQANVERFLHELLPFPLHNVDFDWAVAARWGWEILEDKGFEALYTTFLISVAAIVLASVVGALLTIPAARNIATDQPFGLYHGSPSVVSRLLWKIVFVVTRGVLILLRSIPEYVWAFLLLALLGPTVWSIVLALALHNAGILGKLSAEVTEDLPPAPLRALHALGASRAHVSVMAVLPVAFPRFLLFFFYRWETCVREATVLGMLGIASLGFWIQEARTRNFYDEMIFLVLLGVILIIVGDVFSSLARRWLRRLS
ncbi:MAG: ABC transporter permease subunit [Gammaproteobacteria bacterium]|nr:ABC transporter permease subunit [Gammaproteobacteria bacterium]